MIAVVFVVLADPAERQRLVQVLDEAGYDPVGLGHLDEAPPHVRPALVLGESEHADLTLGVDVPVPCSSRQLLHAVRRRLRGTSQVVLSDRTVDLERGEVHVGDRTLSLTTKEVELLEVLADHPGTLVPKEALIEAVWGATSSSTLSVTLHRLRKKLEADATEPRHLLTRKGVGVRLVTVTAETPVVPAAPTPLIGREHALARVRAALASGVRLVTLMGPGGCGKTRLALEVAQRERAWFVDLTAARTEADVQAAVGAVLELGLGPDPTAQLGAAMAARGRALWIVDNAEQVADAVAGMVGDWLAAHAELAFLVTSRVELGVAGERRVRLPPLELDDAIALLRHSSPGLPDDAELRALAERLDRLPLALHLAAPVAELLGPPDMLQRWDAAVSMMRGPGERHRTVDDAIAWSWELLDTGARAAAVALSTFAGEFDLALAAEVVEGPAPAAVRGLVAASMLQLVAPGRFAMLPTVGDFVGRQDPQAHAAATLRHARALAARARELWPRMLAGEREAFEPVGRLLPDLRAASATACVAGEADAALHLAAAAFTYATRRGPLELIEALVAPAVDVPGGSDPVLRARVQLWLAMVRTRTDPDDAQARCEACLAEVDDAGVRVRATTTLAQVAEARGDLDGALALHERATALAEDEGAHRDRVYAVTRSALFRISRGIEGLDAYVRHMLETCAGGRVADRLLVLSAAHVHLLRTCRQEGEALAREAVRLAAQHGDDALRGGVLNNLGGHQMLQGELSAALRTLEQAEANRTRLGRTEQRAIVWVNLAGVLLQVGDVPGHAATLERADAVFVRMGADLARRSVRLSTLWRLVRVGRDAEARALIAELEQDPELSSAQRVRGHLALRRAELAGAGGDAAEAVAQAETAAAVLDHPSWRLDHLMARTHRLRGLLQAGDAQGVLDDAPALLADARAARHRWALPRIGVLWAAAAHLTEADPRPLLEHARRDVEPLDITARVLLAGAEAALGEGTGPAEPDLDLGDGVRVWSVEARWSAGPLSTSVGMA